MERVIGPLGYAFVILLVTGVMYPIVNVLTLSQWPWPRFSRAIVTLALFVESTWLASLARQIVFELRSGDRLSSHVDTCASAFMPITLAVLAIVTVAVAAGFTTLGRLERHASKAAVVTGRWLNRGQLGAMTLAFVCGAILGVWTWGDWRVDRPCL